jgi:hypothetical protein
MWPHLLWFVGIAGFGYVGALPPQACQGLADVLEAGNYLEIVIQLHTG